MRHDRPDGTQSTSRVRTALLAASAVLCAAVVAVRYWQPDGLAAVVLVPAWCWLVPAVVLIGLGASRRYWRWSLAVALVWVGYAVLFVEEVRSLTRIGGQPTAAWEEARESGRGIRVVSLNCSVASPRAAAEVVPWEPDIVLLQESPDRDELGRLARKLYGADGAHVSGGDASIVARGTIQPHHIDPDSQFVHATVNLSNGLTIEVISLRLVPPAFRLDFWRPGFWAAHREKRVHRRQQVQVVTQRMESIPRKEPLIVGGDFNAPPHDAALDGLEERLFDTFAQAGRGWGNTGPNDHPLFRVDQVWACGHFRAEAVTARKTRYSDHRMVVCDVILKSSPREE